MSAKIVDFPVRRRLAAMASERALDRLLAPAPNPTAIVAQIQEGRIRLIADATLQPWDARVLARELLKLADEAEGRA